MNLRKTAGLLAVTGLIVGLLGSGVGASFFDQVTGTENIEVGTFDCTVTGVTAGGTFDADSATYTAPTILSSAPGSAPFSFDVTNNGTIPMVLSVSAPSWGGTLDGSFSAMAASLSAATLAAGATATVSTGIQWTELDNADLGDTGSATWTVACNEVRPVTLLTGSVAAQVLGAACNDQLAGLDYVVVANPDGSVEFTMKPYRTAGSPYLKALTVNLGNAAATYSRDLTWGSSDGTPPADELATTDGGVTYGYTAPAGEIPSGELGIFYLVNQRCPGDGADAQRFFGITAMSPANNWGGFNWAYANRLKVTLP